MKNWFSINHLKIFQVSNLEYTPKESIRLAGDLKILPTDKSVAIFYYTGQTSAFLVAYLRLLGAVLKI